MLDDVKSQAIYTALRASSGLASPAADKATAALGKADSLSGRFASLHSLATGADAPAVPPVIIPPPILAAAGKIAEYQGIAGGAGSVLESLGGAIDQRMEDVTSKFAVFGVAANVAQKMGEQAGGCGPLAAAFSVLTSTSGTDMLQAAMDMAAGPLGELEDLIGQYANSLTGSMSAEDEGLLADLLASMDGITSQIKGAYEQVSGLVAEAQAMWGELQTSFNQAIQASILGSIINNPCLRDIADSVMPENVKGVIDGFTS